MTFGEDQSRVRKRHLSKNFGWLNRFALSLLKQHPGRQSVAMKRRGCGWSDAFLLEVVTVSTCYFALTLAKYVRTNLRVDQNANHDKSVVVSSITIRPLEVEDLA